MLKKKCFSSEKYILTWQLRHQYFKKYSEKELNSHFISTKTNWNLKEIIYLNNYLNFLILREAIQGSNTSTQVTEYKFRSTKGRNGNSYFNFLVSLFASFLFALHFMPEVFCLRVRYKTALRRKIIQFNNDDETLRIYLQVQHQNAKLTCTKRPEITFLLKYNCKIIPFLWEHCNYKVTVLIAYFSTIIFFVSTF